MKKAGRWFVIVFLAVTGVLGFSNGMQEMGDAKNALQLSVQIGDVAWGIFSVMTAIGLWRRRPWTGSMAIVWAAFVTYTASVASFAFSDPTFSQPETKIGTISAGVSTIVVCGLIAWYARRATRAQASQLPQQ